MQAQPAPSQPVQVAAPPATAPSAPAAARAGTTSTSSAQLPRTGADVLPLALLGVVLLGAGVALLRRRGADAVAETGSAAETEALAAELAAALAPGDVVLVSGDLGAGQDDVRARRRPRARRAGCR